MSVAATGTVKKPVHPFAVRDFRVLWFGESISLLGDQFYLIALPWLVLELTGSALALGAVMALAGIPRALFMIIGGAFVDRFSPRAVMFASNLTRMILVGLLAVLVLTNAIQLWMLYLFALAFGTADAFFFPAESSIVPQILQPDQLEMGNTLTQGMAMLSMFLGPVLAGIVIAVLGTSSTNQAPGVEGIGIAFALDALSFLASILALWLLRVRKQQPAAATKDGMFSAIKAGMRYVWDSAVLRTVFVLLIAINLFVTGPFAVGIPVLANSHLAEGAAAFGILMSAYGGGALLGIILASVLPRPRPVRFGTVLLGVTALLGIGLVLLPFSSSTAIGAVICLAMGTTMGYVNIHFMTWLQKRIPDALMGRVMSLIMFASIGIGPVSTALAGAILTVNFYLLFVGAGVLMSAVTLLSLTRPPVRQMGLEVEEIEKKASIAEALRSTGELAAVTSTASMPAVHL